MIFDQQNMYMDNSLTSNVIANVGGGDAADPVFLVITAPPALATSGAIAAALAAAAGFVQPDCSRRLRRQIDCWLV